MNKTLRARRAAKTSTAANLISARWQAGTHSWERGVRSHTHKAAPNGARGQRPAEASDSHTPASISFRPRNISRWLRLAGGRYRNAGAMLSTHWPPESRMGKLSQPQRLLNTSWWQPDVKHHVIFCESESKYLFPLSGPDTSPLPPSFGKLSIPPVARGA